jgi:hypothetical protein
MDIPGLLGRLAGLPGAINQGLLGSMPVDPRLGLDPQMLQQARQGASTDFAMGLVAGGNNPQTLLASRRGATEGFRNRLIDIMREQEMARMMESRDEQQKKEAAYRATLPAEVQPVADVAGLPNIAARQAEIMMSPQQQPWRILTPEEEARVPGLDPALMYKTNGQDIEVLGGRPPAPTIGNLNIGGAKKEWLPERVKAISDQMTKYEETADTSFGAIQRFDALIEQSRKATLTGALAPGVLGAGEFLRSFGIDLAPEALTDARALDSMINANHMQWVADLGGARGMTDSENKKLAQALVKVQDSVEARVEVAKLLRDAEKRKYENARRGAKRKQQQLQDIEGGGYGLPEFDEVPNAPIAPKYRKGDTATNPQTGETLEFDGERWAPKAGR